MKKIVSVKELVDNLSKEEILVPEQTNTQDQAQALYVLGGLSMREVAEKVKVSKSTVQRWAAKGHWAIIKKNKTSVMSIEAEEGLLGNLTDSVRFNYKVKEIAKNMLGEGETINDVSPKDLEIIQRIYTASETRINALLLVDQIEKTKNVLEIKVV